MKIQLVLTTIILLFVAGPVMSQTQDRLDSLKQEIIHLQAEVDNINLNLEKSRTKFQKGILIATIGYTVTIAGGLMLGRENDSLGQVLLITGGVTGITGTYMMVDAFKFLGRSRKE
ncbi:hypothetical protein [Fulvivirga sedimenti]|uniref:Uncharacterized protein n=1 Tax=Fulvivirga sedimenti TaxID=2879465 RepID=A0A9X1L0Q1_9BACT|nr:hypothetical protein [Fulvivirga sedimenti]MCA6074919.1 hypothetical protein [Fulvivirga sedimenti]MCA6076096.1 hypothetical protein [Fulvivirga sedimenti]MCA6077224.1 hypothetical protein [Fulvivirga sedimenti]